MAPASTLAIRAMACACLAVSLWCGSAWADGAAESKRLSSAAAADFKAGNLAAAEESDGADFAWSQFDGADNMTDSLSALRLLTEAGMPDGEAALASFYDRWQHEALVVNKWFSLQAMIEDDEALARVERLLAHPAFSWSNPNRVRAVLGVFAMSNLVGFHRRDGAG